MVEQGTFGNMKYGSTSHANKKRHKRRKKQTFPKMTKRKKIIITALPACERRFGTCAGPNADVRSASPMENGLSLLFPTIQRLRGAPSNRRVSTLL